MSHSQQKPKIKSIVPTNFPIEVLQGGKRVLVIKDKNKTDIDSVVYEQNFPLGPQNEALSSSSSIHCFEVNKLKSKNKLKQLSDSETLSEDESIENRNQPTKNEENKNFEILESCDKIKNLTLKNSDKEPSKSSETYNTEKSSNSSNKFFDEERLEKCVTNIECNDSDQDSDIEITKILRCNQPQELNSIACTPQSNLKLADENKTIKCNKFIKNFVNFKEDKENSQAKNKCYKSETSSSIKALKDATNPSHKVFKNDQVRKCGTVNKKSQNVLCKNRMVKKDSPIKKSTIFNVEGKKCCITVQASAVCKNSCGAGISCTNCNSKSSSMTQCKKKIESQNLLSGPEYNSTICVIKKLKEVEKEKLIPDFDHLAPEYKNFINGKVCLLLKIFNLFHVKNKFLFINILQVSSALDFSPYETVYKDLINLSLDKDKLPARLKRSKDPEPRDKDITPSLSDFYNPKCIEQYFVIANPITPDPISVSTQSSFKINKKISTWKLSRDYCE